ncbi:uncharacterized protein LOC128558785 [Mercenaria mercenaria]|uniref:uncharacterized protein LOC128558785 n=1 Tax=Mercenaria mercenaria TaxID=6596 RepID=UPI00234E84F9|nr:uncharacterized protein LOC128558785 [Mercenaria mercenaria]
MQSNNLLGNVYDMPLQNRQTSQRPSDYYNAPQRRLPNRRSDRNTNLLPRRLRKMYFGSRNNRQDNRANSGFFGPTFARPFIDRQMAVPGSSYVDTPVSTPPPQTPDVFVYQPGKEPYLSQEQQFLEQQFYLTNELPGSNQQQKPNETGQGRGQEQLAQQMKIVHARQEQLMREQFNGRGANIGTTDPNVERYGLMGPFDGGVPSVPGEVKRLNSMEGAEAQEAIHNVEALH